MRFIVMVSIALFCCFVGLSTVSADDPSLETPAKSWYEYYQQRASNDYELVWSDDMKPLTLKPQAIVNWTNPLEGGKINGSSFVWEHEGRPIVVGQFFSYLIGGDRRSFCHVFSTLSDEQVIARRDGKEFWKPELESESGWHVASDSATPAPTRPIRLIQMRNLARKFSAYTTEKSRGKRNLRLLSQPLYRYDESNKEADGGIFAYVIGNDPELLILIECGLTQNDSGWKFRFAQSTKSTTIATLDDKQIYHYDNTEAKASSQSAVYLSRHGVETIPSTLPSSK